MSQLSDLVSQAIIETEKGDGVRDYRAAASLVVERADEDGINHLAHRGAMQLCKKAAEKQGPAARRATTSRGQTEMFPNLHIGYVVDPESNTIKMTGKLNQMEFMRIIGVREKQIFDDAAHLQQLRDAYDAVRPIWSTYPHWTFDECCFELAARREAS